MIGVNSGDGRGNITAYATVFDSKSDAAGESRLLGLLAEPEPGRLVHLRRLVHERGRPLHGLLDLRLHDRHRPRRSATTTRRPTSTTSARSTTTSVPERRYSLGAMGHYEFGEHADVYTQLMFNDYESVAQIAPSGNFFRHDHDQLRQPVPAGGEPRRHRLRRPPQVAAGTSVSMYIGRRNVEGGGRQQSFANNSFRTVAGVRGAINEAWGYDASAQYSSSGVNTATLNYFVTNRLQRALDVVDVGGVPTCQSVHRRHATELRSLEPVPAEPGHGGAAQLPAGRRACRSAASARRSTTASSPATSASTASSRRWPPTASRSCSAPSTGATRSTTTSTPCRRGQPARRRRRRRRSASPARPRSNELFMEARRPDRAGPGVRREPVVRHRVPVLGLRQRQHDRHLQVRPRVGAGAGRPLARQLPARGACGEHRRAVHRHRASTCSTRRAIPAARRRATRRRAMRSASRPACRRTWSARRRSTARRGSTTFLQGGNPNLTPEESDTYSYGVVFTPRFAPGLAVTVDYFDI